MHLLPTSHKPCDSRAIHSCLCWHRSDAGWPPCCSLCCLLPSTLQLLSALQHIHGILAQLCHICVLLSSLLTHPITGPVFEVVFCSARGRCHTSSCYCVWAVGRMFHFGSPLTTHDSRLLPECNPPATPCSSSCFSSTQQLQQAPTAGMQ